MFNFQKEIVLNNEKDMVVVEGHSNLASPKTTEKKLRVLEAEYFGKYIMDKKVYKTTPVSGQPFELDITVTDDMLGQHIQVLIELGLDRDYRGDYGSALWYFRKPVLVDVILPADATEAAKVLAKAIKAVVPAEYRFLDAEADAAVVKVTGADSYQKVRKVVVSRYDCEDRCGNGSEEPVELLNLATSALVAGVAGKIKYVANQAEFGTYEYILHNLRLPTYANLRFTSPMEPEMPVKGATYVQYSFAYQVPRVNLGGMSVVGQVNQSVTVHTIYVKSDLAGKFEGHITDDLGGTIEDTRAVAAAHDVTVLPAD